MHCDIFNAIINWQHLLKLITTRVRPIVSGIRVSSQTKNALILVFAFYLKSTFHRSNGRCIQTHFTAMSERASFDDQKQANILFAPFSHARSSVVEPNTEVRVAIYGFWLDRGRKKSAWRVFVGENFCL